MDWIYLAQEQVDSSYEHGKEPSGSLECWEVFVLVHD
jgi:hypothetical protein